jgi:hypothetical protein
MDGVGSSDSFGGSMDFGASIDSSSAGGFDSASISSPSPSPIDTGPSSFGAGSSFDSGATAFTGATDSFASAPDPFGPTPLASDPFAASPDPFGSNDPFTSTTPDPFASPPTLDSDPFASSVRASIDSTPSTDWSAPAPSVDAFAPSVDLSTTAFTPVSFLPTYTPFDFGSDSASLGTDNTSTSGDTSISDVSPSDTASTFSDLSTPTFNFLAPVPADFAGQDPLASDAATNNLSVDNTTAAPDTAVTTGDGLSGNGTSNAPASDASVLVAATGSAAARAEETPIADTQIATKGQGVEPYETGTFKELKANSLPNDGLDIDHQPSKAAQIKAAEEDLGRTLTAAEKQAVINDGTAVAVPEGVHRAGPTYGGRNTGAQIATDAKDLEAAAARDAEAMVKNAGSADKTAAQQAADWVKSQYSSSEATTLVAKEGVQGADNLAGQSVERASGNAVSRVAGQELAESGAGAAARAVAGRAGAVGAAVSAGISAYENRDGLMKGDSQAIGRVAGDTVVGGGAAAAGVAAGAAIGSVVPVAGTIVGAGVGLVVGLAADQIMRAGGVDKMVGNAVSSAVDTVKGWFR